MIILYFRFFFFLLMNVSVFILFNVYCIYLYDVVASEKFHEGLNKKFKL